jgi:hypothetical protein
MVASESRRRLRVGSGVRVPEAQAGLRRKGLEPPRASLSRAAAGQGAGLTDAVPLQVPRRRPRAGRAAVVLRQSQAQWYQGTGTALVCQCPWIAICIVCPSQWVVRATY